MRTALLQKSRVPSEKRTSAAAAPTLKTPDIFERVALPAGCEGQFFASAVPPQNKQNYWF